MDRSVKITIAGKDYNLVLTTRATKEIAAKYGGLEKFNEKVFESKDFAVALDEIIWLIALLANQGIMIENLKDGKQRKLLTPEQIELLTTPFELTECKTAIIEAMNKGTNREIISEEPAEKNSPVE